MYFALGSNNRESVSSKCLSFGIFFFNSDTQYPCLMVPSIRFHNHQNVLELTK